MGEIVGREGSEGVSGPYSYHLGPLIFKLPPWPGNRLSSSQHELSQSLLSSTASGCMPFFLGAGKGQEGTLQHRLFRELPTDVLCLPHASVSCSG